MATIRTIGFRKLDVEVVTAGTAVKISDDPIFTTEFSVYVKSGNSGANGYIGDITVDNTWIPRPKGGTYNFVHGEGDLEGTLAFDLSKIYIDSDGNGDDFIVQYLAFDR